MVVEDPKITEGITGGEVKEEDVYSGDTVVLSEGGTWVIRSGEEKNVAEELNREEEVDQQVGNREEEMEQAVGNREEVILETGDGGVDEEGQAKEVADQRSSGHKDITVRKLAETLATSGRTAEKGEDSEDEEEEEEITLIRRPRSSRRPVTEGTPVQEERQEEITNGVAEIEEERERRKRKQIARPVKMKVTQASRNVVIQEPIQAAYGVTEEEATGEEEELRWERRTKKRQEEPLPHYKKMFIKMDNHLLKQMEKFKDTKLQEECKKRVSGGKKAKSGKKLHQPSLQDLGAEEKFLEYITGIGFEWLLESDVPEVPVALAKEFFTSFRFKTTTDLDEKSISFRVCDRNMRMSLIEWSVRLGLYSADQAGLESGLGETSDSPEATLISTHNQRGGLLLIPAPPHTNPPNRGATT